MQVTHRKTGTRGVKRGPVSERMGGGGGGGEWGPVSERMGGGGGGRGPVSERMGGGGGGSVESMTHAG